jgi:ribonuclease HI
MSDQLHEFFKTQANLDYFISKLSQKSIKSILSDLEIKVVKNKPSIELSLDSVLVFTDGSCLNNGKSDVKAAFSVAFNNSEYTQFNHTEIMTDNLSNNGAELSAILYTVKTICDNREIFGDQGVTIVSDSLYAIKCINGWSKKWIENGWVTSKKEPVKNRELIQEILIFTQQLNITFKHIFSHQSQPLDTNSIEYLLWSGNDIVDKNCTEILS